MTGSFYARDVVEVARALVGGVVRHGGCSGTIVETEAYHASEPACHAYVGLTPRTRVLFGPPGQAYVYRSYGVHALLNAVCESEGIGAAVLIRALEPVDGLDEMRPRRGLDDVELLCAGPGRLTQALGIGLELNDTPLTGGPVAIEPPRADSAPALVAGPRVGITRATELPWRFCLRGSRFVSRPWPRDLAAPRPARARAA
ncbi:MAG: DNA-3-methyladenine glycosylase [Solirubrobacteraceae bacterium]|jgi:DNA-3-methyladenine glycosylase|nr:DNA-3-methyladenine glycosylase [Solirubrobacteraceae bacterium]